ARGVLSQLPPPLQVRLISAWASDGALTHHAVTDTALLAHAVNLARHESDEGLLAMALAATYNAARATQEVPVDVSHEFCEVASRVNDPYWQGQAHLAGLIDAVTIARVDQANAHLEAYLRAANTSLSPRSSWEASMVRSTWALLRGDIHASDRHAHAAVE